MPAHRETPRIIPVDSLALKRRVTEGTQDPLKQKVLAAASETTGLEAYEVRGGAHLTVSSISKKEYAHRKREHPILGEHSVIRLANLYNTWVNGRGQNQRVGEVSAGKVRHEELPSGNFLLGFTVSDFRERLMRERRESIDALLRLTGILPTDPIRDNWHKEKKDFWLPVLEVTIVDPAQEEILAELGGNIEQQTSDLTIDFYETRARPGIFNLPVRPAQTQQ